MSTWNPWHGCKKISPGCTNCYVYRRDAEFGKDSSVVTRTSKFDMPVKCNRKGDYKLQPDGESVYTCMTSDFFLDEADVWRAEAWNIIRRRSDLHFVIITGLRWNYRGTGEAGMKMRPSAVPVRIRIRPTTACLFFWNCQSNTGL